MNIPRILKTAMVLAFIYVAPVGCGKTDLEETIRGEDDLLNATVNVVKKIESVSNDVVKIDAPSRIGSLIVKLGTTNYEFTDQNPDVRVLEVESAWAPLPDTEGYAPASVRFGSTRSGKKSIRIVEVHERWAAEVPQYFVDHDAPTRIAVVGHLRGLIKDHADVFEMVAEAINAQTPDYIYLLGDFVFSSSDDEYDLLEASFLDKLVAPYVYVPGNHESRARGGDTVFQNRVGEPIAVISTDTVNIVALDSSDSLAEVEKALAVARNQVDPDKLTLLMTHHKVWKKRKKPPSPYKKSFTSTEFMPLVNTWVNFIFDGDSDDEISRTSLKEGTVDSAYSIGSGKKGTNTQIYFVMASVSEGPDQVLRVIPNFIDLDIVHPYYLEP